MRSIWATRLTPPVSTPIRPTLNRFADECRGMLMHLAAYLGVLALLVIIGAHLWGKLPAGRQSRLEPGHPLIPGFRRQPVRFVRKTETYQIFRHPEGGRKDVLRWTAQGEKPVAELEIDRSGRESSGSGTGIAEIAARMGPEDRRELEAAGIIESKFGAVTLLRPAGDASDRCPVLALSNSLMSPRCGYRAGRVGAMTCRPGVARLAACWTG
jgi:hypothetical protein